MFLLMSLRHMSHWILLEGLTMFWVRKEYIETALPANVSRTAHAAQLLACLVAVVDQKFPM